MSKTVIYSRIKPFTQEYAAIKRQGKWGYIDKNGKLAVPCIYTSAASFSEGLAPVRKDGKCGFIDARNNTVIPFKYENACAFSEGLAAVKYNKKWGFINKLGEEVIPCVYDYVDDFSEGLAVFSYNEKYGFIDIDGKMEIPNIYDFAHSFNSGIACVDLNKRRGYINKRGELVIPLKYEDFMCYECTSGVVALQEDGRDLWNLYDNAGKLLISSMIYTYIEGFQEGYAVVCNENGFSGCINTKGEEVIPCEYDALSTFSCGLIAAMKNKKWGFIDAHGNEVVPFKYCEVGDFYNDMAHVYCASGKSYIIDKTGKKIFTLKKEISYIRTFLFILLIILGLFLIFN